MKQILLDLWNGERDMDVTLNGRDACVDKLRNGTMVVESKNQRAEVIGNKWTATELEDGSIEGVVYWRSFAYKIRLVPVED
jgi:exosome complex RNA-binding protein Rrp4